MCHFNKKQSIYQLFFHKITFVIINEYVLKWCKMEINMKRPYQLLAENVEINYPFMQVGFRHFEFEKFKGGRGELNFLIVKKADAVCLTLYDKDKDSFLLIRQFRPGAAINEYETNPYIWSVVAGHIDIKNGIRETPRQTAAKEANEEAGIIVSETNLIDLGAGYTSAGSSSEKHHHFLCAFSSSDIDKSKTYGIDDEDIEVGVFTSEEALHMIDTGQIACNEAILGIRSTLLFKYTGKL